MSGGIEDACVLPVDDARSGGNSVLGALSSGAQSAVLHVAGVMGRYDISWYYLRNRRFQPMLEMIRLNAAIMPLRILSCVFRTGWSGIQIACPHLIQ